MTILTTLPVVSPYASSGSVQAGSEAAEAGEKNTGKLAKAALYKVRPDGSIDKGQFDAGALPLAQFYLNPSSFDESNSANWAPQNIPGQSDPVLQFIHGGARKVNFEALITRDTADFDGEQEFEREPPGTVNQSLDFVGRIASSFFNISTPPSRLTAEQNATQGTQLDITRQLNYYRSMLYPEYDDANNPRRLRQSPPLLVLVVGSSIPKLKYGDRISNNHDVWILSNLKIKITKQLPNLAPMEALVTFELTQYNIRSFDSRRFTREGF